MLLPSICFADNSNNDAVKHIINATTSTPALVAVGVFVIAYILVVLEEFIHLRKSKPVVLASGVIWIIVALLAQQKGMSDVANAAIKHNILEYGELFLFLLVAMTYVNAMEERNVFSALRGWLVSKGYSLRTLFWATGFLAFFISPIADNLTTALIMCAVLMAVGKDYPKFVAVGCVNIVVASNAGGAFSPFGDITTLMVWQAGELPFQGFFKIFIPSLVSFVIPAAFMHFAIPNVTPEAQNLDIKASPGAKRIVFLFILTIATAVCFHNFLHLPPTAGMMMGLGYIKFFGYYLKRSHNKLNNIDVTDDTITDLVPFDIMKKIERVEWDTLLFFYGVVLCVGGLATLGYLEIVSSSLYNELGASMPALHRQTPANIIVGLLSAVIDNIPVMFAVLTMDPYMSEGQWLLVTLTAGIGGSLLSIGSAAGVALMGQARGVYTFFSHLKWSWVILIGYFAGIFSHIWLNSDTFMKF